MALWREYMRRLAYLGRRSRFDQELRDEIQFHIETRSFELEQEGLPHAEARAKALREFGSTLHAREETHSVWQVRWLEDLCGDLHYAARAFRRNPSFAFTAITCLALAIGANTTMFSVAMEVFFSEPSCRDPQSLVQVQIGGGGFCPAEQYRFLRDAHVFDALVGMNIGEVSNLRDSDGSSRLAGTRVTDNFFEVTGVPVAMGRSMQSGETGVTVVTHQFWTRRLGADPNVLGRKLVLDGRPYIIVGVLPHDHRNLVGFGFTPDLYLPIDSGEYLLYARLPQAMGRQVVYARLEALCREMDRVYPNASHKWAQGIMISAVGGVERLRAEGGMMEGGLMIFAAFFGMLMVVTGLVLLIACANVSSLLLARAFSRSRELAIRLSLGGSRGRIIRQLLAESLLLAACATGVGLLINICLTKLLSSLPLPLPLPFGFHIQPDWRLLTYSIGIAFVVTLAAGFMPALKGTHIGISAALKQHERWQANHRWTPRNALVIVQLIVSIVLLSGGWLFVRNLLNATSLNLGFDTSHTIWATFRAIPATCSPERFTTLIDGALERLRALPGVASVAPACSVPMSTPYRVGGEICPDVSDHAIHAQYHFNAVGPDYFQTMQIPILQGRSFLDSDRSGAPAAVILNENLARLLFGNISPVGHAIRLPDNSNATVVGIARNSKYSVLGEGNAMALYQPWAQFPHRQFAHLLVQARNLPEGIVRNVSRTLGDLDPTAAVETKTVRDALQFTLLPSRLGAGVLGTMALLGLTLASVGLYGVLLYVVSRRIREIGVRVALGATPARILGLIAGESARLVVAGLAIGLGVSVFAVRPLTMFLVPGVRPDDPMNFVVVACALAFVAVLASVPPTVRALRVDSAVALRHE